jgi:HSP20 family protein
MRIVRYSYPNFRQPALSAGFSRAPWTSLETEIDRLFDTALGNFAGNDAGSARFPVNVYEDEGHTYVRAELPGVNREEVNVEIVDGYLNIAATRKTPASEGKPEESVSLRRSLELPEQVQADQISAAYENGVLTVTLPKREDTKPRKISVSVK